MNQKKINELSSALGKLFSKKTPRTKQKSNKMKSIKRKVNANKRVTRNVTPPKRTKPKTLAQSKKILKNAGY